jgi:ATP synthase F1 delta subunit
MAELATIARPYADALFKAQSADLAGTAAWLDELAAVASNSQLLQFSENPKVTDAQVFDLISGVVKNTLPAAAQNFLRLVIENSRLVALPEIASQFRALKMHKAAQPMRSFTVLSPSKQPLWLIFLERLKNALAANSTSVLRSMRHSLVAFAWSWGTRCWTLPSRPVWNK